MHSLKNLLHFFSLFGFCGISMELVLTGRVYSRILNENTISMLVGGLLDMPDASITKNALAAALKTLMTKKPFAKISIGDICEHCHMNRRSFYYHFQDKYDLTVWIFNVEFLDLMREKEYDTSLVFALDICSYFFENKDYYIDLFSTKGQNSFHEYFFEIFTPLFVDAIRPYFSEEEDAMFCVEFYADAFVLSIEKWLLSNALQPEEYVEKLKTATQGMARRAMHQMQT